jgi:hypothetical protein
MPIKRKFIAKITETIITSIELECETEEEAEMACMQAHLVNREKIEQKNLSVKSDVVPKNGNVWI